ncbi:Bug family tripartite tricarboxylate transporter substrate binding protein [Variovorax terrae]|uniref:Tripartite tricarboxylate transporter substrate binding protein n=1 Tax=Variovorax terrae TaxID=2923278 RepID=A0A9X1VVN9_9BURK|nr:tripartite tricarboxylate transporter substrate binding protein [Variovorax terrae]MCJ0764034.1 tripartite tricarboxylate transporter substrate binding protein [Variovorax terrae]
MKRRQLLSLALAGAAARPAFAEAYPSRPIVLVMPFPAGGSVDVFGRAIALHLSTALKQPIVVDNRAGAGGLIGAGAVAKGKKDGYMLLLSSSSTHSLAAALRSNLPYDPEKDFAPVVNLGSGISSLLIPASSSVRTVAELVAAMKQRGDQNSFGSAGIGTIAHLSAEDFMLATGVRATHVPYKGTSLAVQDLAAGRLSFMFDSSVSAEGYVRGGLARMLAVTGRTRLHGMPDVPTMAEAGIKLANPEGYFGVWAPAGTPREIVLALNGALNDVLKSPEVVALMQKLSITARGGTPEDFAQRVAADSLQWKKAVQRANVPLE